MQVKWVRKALRNLEQIHEYISREDSAAAARIILKIQAAVKQLEDFPMMGRVGRAEATRELAIINTPYFAVYRIKGNAVEILRILHTSRRYPE
jgi:toxin ParE1/3/4